MMKISKSAVRAGAARLPARAQTKLMAVKPEKAASLAAVAALAAAAPARAEDAVDSAVSQLVGAIQAAGAAAKVGLETVDAGLAVVKQGIEVATPVVKQAYSVAEPYVEEAVKAAAPVVQSAVPVVQQSLNEAVVSSGIPVSTISQTATTVVATAKEGVVVATPYVNAAVAFLASKDPTTLGEYALGAVALWYLSPALLAAAAGALRGYAGELPAAEALNQLTERDCYLVDIRSAKEKESSGLPDVAAGARSRVFEVELAVTEDRKLRGQLRNAGAIETQVTALQIAALKGLSKGSRIVLLDRYGNSAAAVAKELGRRGFGRVYTVAGGFDGRNGWVQSKLQIKPAVIASAPAATGTLFSARGTVPKKALPAPKA